jgi:trimeric autotransporter adhesin
MNRHGSMNRVYRLVWNLARIAWVPVAETARGRGKSGRTRAASRARATAATATAAAALALGLTPLAQAGPSPAVPTSTTSSPTGGKIVSGKGNITQSGDTTTVDQSSQTLSINWASFNIAPQDTVDFVQPNASAVAVNRIAGNNGSVILGHLDANGQVYLINPNGIVFGKGSEVNVGGLVASTLALNGDPSGNSVSLSGTSSASVTNEGTINAASGGYVALLANKVSNTGVITAQLGTVALGAGNALTLTFSGNNLVHLQVDQSVLKTLVQNGGLIQADGGQVILSAGAKNAVLASVVNNTGVIEARTVENHEGTITLLGGMQAGTVEVAGTLDASAPNGGDGGFIETSAAQVEVADGAKISTVAPHGLYGSWFIDPHDFTVAASGGDISGAMLSSELAISFVMIDSSAGKTLGNGNVNVDDTVSWTANTTLTLTASNNVNINSNLTATGSMAALAIKPNTANGGEPASGSGTLNLGASTSLSLSGANASLSISSPNYTLSSGATINLPNVSPTAITALTIGGTSYTVINSLGAQGSVTGTDLQGINGKLAGHFALGSNVDATAADTWNGGAGFTPLGTPSSPFTGQFDGLGHSVDNLVINLPSGIGVGLFGAAGPLSLIQNVGVLGGVTGNVDVGGLVGNNYGTISNSYSTANVAGLGIVGGLVGHNFTSGTINTSYATGAVTGSSSNVGGLLGINQYGLVSNSYATGRVQGTNYVGGLVGVNYGFVAYSHATGSVTGVSASATDGVGGLVGRNYNEGQIGNSYATGSVSGYLEDGGLVGQNYGTVSNSYATGSTSSSAGYTGGLVGLNGASGKISTSYAVGKVTSPLGAGGLVGTGGTGVSDSFWDTTTSQQSTSAGGTGLTTTQMLTASNFAGFTFTATPGGAGWVMIDLDGTLNNAGLSGATFPMLASEYSTTITNLHQLQLMTMDGTAHYTLGQSIDGTAADGNTDVWAGGVGFVSVPVLSGTFDGMGYTILDLKTTNMPNSNLGLFGIVTAAGVVRNVGLVDGSVTGAFGGGALVGINYGTVSNSSSSASVVKTTTVDGDVGGLVGDNFGTIINSYATGSVTNAGPVVGGLVGGNIGGKLVASYATGVVKGTEAVGGLVGENFGGPITNSYAMAAVNGTAYVGGLVGFNYGTIATSYAAGKVSGSSNVGGLVGVDGTGGTVSNSFWDTTTSGQMSSSGGLGMTTVQMQTQANFTSATNANGNVNPNWDFTNTWTMYSGHTYPLLTAFMTPLTVMANSGSVTYTGSVYSGALGVSYSATPDFGLFSGTLSYSSSPSPATNVGSYSITPGGLYSTSQQGYAITYASGSLAITPASVTVSGLSGTTRAYNGSTVDALSGNPVINGVLDGQTLTLGNDTDGTLASANAGSEAVSTGITLSNGTGLASNYTLTQPTLSNVTISPASLTITGLSGTSRTYNGSKVDALSGTPVLNGLQNGETLTLGNDTDGTLASANVGSEALSSAITLANGTGLASNYTLTQPTLSNVTISQLASVTWVGAATGSWANPANWAGGAIPDFANVATVIIPSGKTVTFGSTVGATTLQKLSSAGTLDVTGGTLDVTGNLTTAGYEQTGGTLDVGGALTVHSTSGAVSLGNIDAGSMSITATAGAIAQIASSALDVTGVTTLTADNGVSGSGDVKYAITLASSTDKFSGAVSADGSAISLDDDTALTVSLDSTRAVSLKAAGAMDVSGTIGTNLTTVTTGGTASTTTFGTTTIGDDLTVTSPGAVTTATTTTRLIVDGAGTHTANSHVTVNGVNGAIIK